MKSSNKNSSIPFPLGLAYFSAGQDARPTMGADFAHAPIRPMNRATTIRGA